MNRLKVPKENQAVLVVPSLEDSSNLLARNREGFNVESVDVLSRSLRELRTLARGEAIEAARKFHHALGLPWPSTGDGSLILTGQQPELFHPGVWIKNFALCGLARKHGLTPLNIIIDNDAVKSTAIRVPLAGARPRVERIAFAAGAGATPFEEFDVDDEDRFARFPNETMAKLRRWAYEPIIGKLWGDMNSVARHTRNLAHRLGGGRRLWEERWGCRNLEVPMSRLCQTEAFAWFVCHILAELPRFHQVHDECLGEFRRRHRIRSRNRPVPDLQKFGDWLEMPFWVWRKGDKQRERLFVRRHESEWELGARTAGFARVPVGSMTPPAVVSVWRRLEDQGFKIRTRAITTTLFCRLFLADLFIHGIGGAVYDELTDEIVRRFYGLQPPGFLVVSGTLHLPLDSPASANGVDLHHIRRLLRDLWHNPDRHLSHSGAEELCKDKREWVALAAGSAGSAVEKHNRFRAIHRLNEQLRPYVENHRRLLLQQEEMVVQAERTRRILTSRDYAYCIHPEETLRPFLTGLSETTC